MTLGVAKSRLIRLLFLAVAGLVFSLGCSSSDSSDSSNAGGESGLERAAGKIDGSHGPAERPPSVVIPGQFDIRLEGKDVEIHGRVDAATDTFTITSWTDMGGSRWMPRVDQLPLQLRAFNETGSVFDVPTNWEGTLDGFAFLLPADRDATMVSWNEGPAEPTWKGSSFGWGGLRNSTGKIVLGNLPPGSKPGNSDFFKYVPAGRTMKDIRFDQVIVTPATTPGH